MLAKDFYSDSHLVDILMPAYNQEQYISQAIRSVLMQKSTFAFRLIIGEDCSTDITLQICEKFANLYPDKILLLKHSSNIGMAANYKELFDTVTSKYVAILEGDDYWTDKHKLQKQVDILESNPEVGLVHTNYFSLYENGKKKKGHLWEKTDSNSGNVIGPYQITSVNINPLTTCFRADLAKENVDFDFIIDNRLLTVDVFLWAEICRRSSVFYIDEISGIYRVHSRSLTGNREISAIEKFSATSLSLVNYLMEKYNTPTEIKEAFLSQHKIDLIYQYLLANQPENAKKELSHVKNLRSLKQKIIYISAKYKSLNFLCKLMSKYYMFGSFLKQTFNIGLELFNKRR
ncbi:MAG: glycosyltransferase [Bacteroidales bacterium]|nr:glycosyltransferase [Bacteroidales bacterium]